MVMTHIQNCMSWPRNFKLPSYLNESVALEIEMAPFLPTDNAINDTNLLVNSETTGFFAQWNESLSLLLKSNLVTFLSTLAFRQSLPNFLESFLRYSQRPSQNPNYHSLHKFELICLLVSIHKVFYYF